MEQGTGLPVDPARALLEQSPLAAAVYEEGGGGLLYANTAARESLLRAVDARALARRAEARVCVARAGGRRYQLNGKPIQWEGRPAYITYITELACQGEGDEALPADGLFGAFESLPCGLCVYRLEGERATPVFHNPAFFGILGCEPDQAGQVARAAGSLRVHPDEIEGLRAAARRAVEQNGILEYTCRVWNDRRGEYRWIHTSGSVKTQGGRGYLLLTFNDVSQQRDLERELKAANEKMQDIINAIPGGVAIYRVSDIFETVYFSDGVPELTGYTSEEYQEIIKQDALNMVYKGDAAWVCAEAMKVLEARGLSTFEFRKQHRDGHLVWVRAQVRWVGEAEGRPLLRCVFLDISALKEARLEMEHLVNSIPGGIASYRIEGERVEPLFISEGVAALTGYDKGDLERLMAGDVHALLYENDKERVMRAMAGLSQSDQVLDISFRICHRDGGLVWVHFNGRRTGPNRFYAVFTGMSAETRLFQTIANETADSIYVIDRANYELLYANESKRIFTKNTPCVGQKCYETLFGRGEPCAFCELKNTAPGDGERVLFLEDTGVYCSMRSLFTDWNGIPACVNYVRDVTERVKAQKEKARLEQYFQSVVKNLPGGVAVIRREKDGAMAPEFLSDGFAAMLGMTPAEAWALYQQDATAGVHPEDRKRVEEQMAAFLSSGRSVFELIYRIRKSDGAYLWVKNTFSIIESEGGESRIYAGYHDVTKEREERELLRRQYNDIILQHYRTPGSNALIVGHCNVTQNRIYEIVDHTHSDLLKTFGAVREDFFYGISTLVVDEEERRVFRETYLNGPSLAAFQRGETELLQNCFIKLPREDTGRYVQFKVNLVETPDTGDVTGILTVTDITEKTVSELILHQLSVASYDLVLDVDVKRDRYTVVTCDEGGGDVPARQGCHSANLAYMYNSQVLPKDREHTREMLDPARMLRRLEEEGPYSFPYAIQGEWGDVRTKNLTVTPIDLRLGRVCLARADITESVREQQGMLNVIAYTFEILAFIGVDSGRMTLYTRRTVLENLPPYTAEDYRDSLDGLLGLGAGQCPEEVGAQLRLDTMLRRLAEKPEGYSFAAPFRQEGGERYKQINVLWGDGSHKTVCMVWADVTDMLAAERQTRGALEQALAAAEEANRAKSDFLASMSHDIRTPMNAIMGMTSLAVHYLEDKDRVEDCLQKITLSSKHLLSLINDILDMSKIEQSKVPLNHIEVYLPGLVDQISAIMTPQAKAAGLALAIHAQGVRHQYFYGDPLRVNQILINILANAIKFTPEGGRVDFTVEEVAPRGGAAKVRYRFTIRDTGIGMSEAFLEHIFEPFVRNRGTASVEGTGLGLSITKGLVDLMQGEITAQSKPHQGTTFQVELECDIASGQTAPPALKEDDGGGHVTLEGYRFLVAEDNAINAEILCELLQMYGAQLVVRADGAQALREFQEKAPGTYDAILMDVQMPEMNGYEATRAIRGLDRPDARAIPIVAMTANAFAEDIQAAMEAGMTAHVAKPIDIQVLTATLHKIFKGGGK